MAKLGVPALIAKESNPLSSSDNKLLTALAILETLSIKEKIALGKLISSIVGYTFDTIYESPDAPVQYLHDFLNPEQYIFSTSNQFTGGKVLEQNQERMEDKPITYGEDEEKMNVVYTGYILSMYETLGLIKNENFSSEPSYIKIKNGELTKAEYFLRLTLYGLSNVMHKLNFMKEVGLLSTKAFSTLKDLIRIDLEYLDILFTNATTAVRYVADPLVVDLDGDGFELLSTEEGVYFDEDAKGLKEKTEWVSADDALLAIDLNEDGIINDGSELFGTSKKLANGKLARTGFEALGQYDDNEDGLIDENDTAFSKLKVWQDKNSDGVSQAGELYSLDELGIAAISLKQENVDGTNSADITYRDGRTTRIGEFDFRSQLYNTKEKNKVELSEEIAQLPDVQAMGNCILINPRIFCLNIAAFY